MRGRHVGAWYFTVVLGSTVLPMTAAAHWEGFEAADPTTPAAVLRFDSAVDGYTAIATRRLAWRTRFADRGTGTAARPDTERSPGSGSEPRPAPSPGARPGHDARAAEHNAGGSQHPSATTQQ